MPPCGEVDNLLDGFDEVWFVLDLGYLRGGSLSRRLRAITAPQIGRNEEDSLEPNTPTPVNLDPNAEFVRDRIRDAREKYEPISRRMIALDLGRSKNVPFKLALDIVDGYCDDHEPGVPGYVSGEFRIYWLKAVAVAIDVVGLGVLWYGTKLYQSRGPAWIAFALGTVIVGFGVLAWVKSLQSESPGG